MKHRILPILLALAMLFSLAACGGSAATTQEPAPAATPAPTPTPTPEPTPDPHAGAYYLIELAGYDAATIANLTQASVESVRGSMVAVLETGGTGTFTVDGDVSDITWTISGSTLTMRAGDETIEGTLSGDEITLDFDGDTVVLSRAVTGNAVPTEDTPDWGQTVSAGGITVTVPEEWVPSDKNWTGPWAAIYEDGEMLGALYLMSASTADPKTAAGYQGEVFTREYGGKTYYCAFRGSSQEAENPSYSLDLYGEFSAERSLDVRLSIGHATQEELLAFTEKPIFGQVMASIRVNPADFVDPNKGVDASGFQRDNDGVLTAYTGSDSDVVIPASIQGMAVTGINNGVFKSNTDIETVTLPETLIWIGDLAFDGCTALETVRFNEGLSYIGYAAFRGCESLQDVELPETVTVIDEFAFEDAGNGGYFIAYGPVSYGRSALSGSCFDSIGIGAGSDLSADAIFASCLADLVVLEDGVTGALGDNCFNSTEYLTEIELPEGITALGDSCFLGSGIEHISLPESLEEIGENCFSFTMLNYLVVPAGVKRIGAGALDTYTVMLLGTDIELGADAISAMDLLLPTVYSPDDIGFDIDTDHVWVWHQILLAMDATLDETIDFDDFLIENGQEDLTWFGVDSSLLNYSVWDYDETGRWTVNHYDGPGGDLCVPFAVPYQLDGSSGVDPCELIGDGCYAGSDVTSLTFHAGVWGIGSRILEGCDSLTDLWFNYQVIYMTGEDFAADAFEGIPANVTVHLPESMAEDERAAAISALVGMGMPDTVTYVYYSFR